MPVSKPRQAARVAADLEVAEGQGAGIGDVVGLRKTDEAETKDDAAKWRKELEARKSQETDPKK